METELNSLKCNYPGGTIRVGTIRVEFVLGGTIFSGPGLELSQVKISKVKVSECSYQSEAIKIRLGEELSEVK